MRLILVVEERSALATYLDAIRSAVGELVIVASLGELFSAMEREAFSGILLDVPSLVRATKEEKSLLYDLIHIFPTLRVKWDPRSASVRALFYDFAPGPDAGVDTFVRKQCASFSPRIIRLRDRLPLHLNILVSSDPSFPEGATTRTATLNISVGGCFIIGVEEWEQGSRLWVRMVNLADPAPIGVEVRWRKGWGEAPGIPGVGVRFLEMGPGQQEDIRNLCSKVRSDRSTGR